MTRLLEMTELTKTYRIKGGLLGLEASRLTAVDHVTLFMNEGETLGLVGESGCGKSTLGRLITGLEKPDSGTITYRDRPIADWNDKEFRRMVQIVFQDPYSSLNPRQTIGSAVREPLDIHGLGSRAERNAEMLRLLEQVGLDGETASRYPHEFSGGQRQRIAIARALALRPELIVCDEPVSALDVCVQAQVLSLLRELQTDFGLTYLFISHDLSVISNLCDRVAVMYLGRIVEVADSQSLFAGALHPYTQALIAAIPIPDPAVKKQAVALKGDPPNPAAPPSGCPFHPRCPEAFAKCSSERPELREIRNGMYAACWLY
ncbi:ABC transporter ATP-binding protein [Salidesulfovibrio brasiliensis]